MNRHFKIYHLFLFILISSLAIGQNAPLDNFDAFCTLFDTNYASFEEKSISWQDTCKKYKSQITNETSDEELFEIFHKMLLPLHDGHVSLEAKKLDKRISASRPSRIMAEMKSIPIKERRPLFRKMTEQTLQKNGFKKIKEIGPKFKDEKLFSYTTSETMGYVRFMRCFSKWAIMNGPGLDGQLDEIFDAFQDKDAIIIDIRFNMGGDDKFSQNVVARLIDKEIVGFYKQTRANSKYKQLKARKVSPKGKRPFKNKVVLLTNDRSVSAADVLALMMSQLPHVTIIGEPSNGSYSDLYDKKLPNGWKVTLSNQRYYSIEMKNYEGLGTPVDIEVKNTLQDIQKNEDNVLIKTLEFLKS